MRMIVRQFGDAPGVFIHDEMVGGYTDVGLFADGLRLAGYFCDAERFRDKAAGFESWTFRDVTHQGRAAMYVMLEG